MANSLRAISGLLLAPALWGGLVGCTRVPDVVLIAVDTLRRDHVGAFDAESPARTPAIDALAHDSVLYTQAWSPISVTGPAFATILTGQRVGRHGVLKNRVRGGAALGSDSPTLAELLGKAGYATAAFVSGFTLRPSVGLGRGFNVYGAPAEGVERIPGNLTAAAAVAWLEQQRGPVFLWFHSYDPHGPLGIWSRPPAEQGWRGDPADRERIPPYQRIGSITDPRLYAARYATAVEFADTQVGVVLDALRKSGRYDDALVVFLADHGETFTERDFWFDHGTYAYAEQLHVPLMIKFPKGEQAGERRDALVSLADVAPTVLDVLGIEGRRSMDGASLRTAPGHPWVLGESEQCKDFPILRCPREGVEDKALAARDERYSLVRHPTADGVREELYDRGADPDERRALDPRQAPAALWEVLRALVRERAERLASPQPDAPPDPGEREALRALGYSD